MMATITGIFRPPLRATIASYPGSDDSVALEQAARGEPTDPVAPAHRSHVEAWLSTEQRGVQLGDNRRRRDQRTPAFGWPANCRRQRSWSHSRSGGGRRGRCSTGSSVEVCRGFAVLLMQPTGTCRDSCGESSSASSGVVTPRTALPGWSAIPAPITGSFRSAAVGADSVQPVAVGVWRRWLRTGSTGCCQKWACGNGW